MDNTQQDDARNEALRNVVQRVISWQESATEGTIHDELDKGLREAGVTLTDEQRDRVAQQISDGDQVDVESLSAAGEGGPG